MTYSRFSMRTRVPPLLAACTLGACGSSVSAPVSDPVAGTFVLVSVDGQPLPYVTTTRRPLLPPIESRLIADTLVFVENGRGAGSSVSINRDLETQEETRVTLVRTFVHQRLDNVVTVDSLDCGSNCAISPRQARYTVNGTGLETVGLAGMVARYARIAR